MHQLEARRYAGTVDRRNHWFGERNFAQGGSRQYLRIRKKPVVSILMTGSADQHSMAGVQALLRYGASFVMIWTAPRICKRIGGFIGWCPGQW